jgi:hypothetical protein
MKTEESKSPKKTMWLMYVVMVIAYPIYLMVFKYSNYPVVTLIMTIIFSYGIMNIIKGGSVVIINEKGEEVFVRKRKTPYKIGELLKKIVQTTNKGESL